MTGHPHGPRRRRIVKVNALTYALMVKYMLDGIYSCAELAEMLGCHYVTVCQYARELHRAKAAHICDWQPDKRDRDSIKIYKIGPGKDKQRRRLSASERQRRHRESKRGRAFALSTLGTVPPGVRSAARSDVAAGKAPGVPRGSRKAPRG